MKHRTQKKRVSVRKAPNPLRMDPTRSATLRRAFAVKLRKRFALLKASILRLILEEDALGLKPTPDVFAFNTRWKFTTDPEKIRAFRAWLKAEVGATLHNPTEEELWKRYIEDGFKKGAGRAFDDVRTRELQQRRPDLFAEEKQASVRDFYQGTKDEFLRSAFAQPESVEKVKLLAGRAFDDLDGITSDMSNRISRTLTDGLVQGKGAREIARELADQVDVGSVRAERIARTELIRAHSEGQLVAMEELGVEEVGVEVEWSTAGDDRVCPECSAMEGVVMSLAEARGKIPVHPNCRCAFVPANVGEAKKNRPGKQR